MKEKEGFIMYAINVDSPYVVQEKNVEKFFKNSKKQEGIADKIQALFKPEDFNFKLDENGCLSVSLNVETLEEDTEND